jgi:hypothetical protein
MSAQFKRNGLNAYGLSHGPRQKGGILQNRVLAHRRYHDAVAQGDALRVNSWAIICFVDNHH